jgi:hypothetical protein
MQRRIFAWGPNAPLPCRALLSRRCVPGLSGVVWRSGKAIYQPPVRFGNEPDRIAQTGTIAAVLLFVSAVKLIAEIALMALVGQWILGLMAGAKRETNVFYRTLQVVAQPFVRLARLLSPPVVLDRHVPVVAFLLLTFMWLFATLTKIDLCLQIGMEACK